MKFLSGIFSDNGNPSWSRTGSFIALAASIVWVSHVVFVYHQIPDLTGVTFFVTALYGVNVAGKFVQPSKEKTDGQ